MTKTLKPVLAMSVVALTLLAGCAKGDANTAWSKTKKEIKSKLQVKSWDNCAFLHNDVNKWLKTDEGKNASDDMKNEAKKRGNTVQLAYVFTLKDGSVYTGTATYTTKSKELEHAEVKSGSLAQTVYGTACSAFESSANNASYLTYKVLVK